MSNGPMVPGKKKRRVYLVVCLCVCVCVCMYVCGCVCVCVCVVLLHCSNTSGRLQNANTVQITGTELRHFTIITIHPYKVRPEYHF